MGFDAAAQRRGVRTCIVCKTRGALCCGPQAQNLSSPPPPAPARPQAFQFDPPTTIFLLSMRSGAVGINLTAANHVFLLEPCL